MTSQFKASTPNPSKPFYNLKLNVRPLVAKVLIKQHPVTKAYKMPMLIRNLK